MYEILGSIPTLQEGKNKRATKELLMVVLLSHAYNLRWKGMEDLKPKPIKAT